MVDQTIEDTRSLSTVAIHTSTVVLTTIFSIVGNSLVCLAFCRNRRLRTITNFYVVSLSLIGIIMATVSYPFIAISSGLREWPFGFNFCQVNGFLKYYFSGVSIGILTLTAINRYVCVVRSQFYHGLFTRKRTVASILFVWLLCLIVGLIATLVAPLLFRWHYYYLLCEIDIETQVNKVLTFTVVAAFMILPMCLITFCYGSVYLAIRRHNSAVIPSLQQKNNQRILSGHEIQASRILLAAVITFFICWLPTTVVKILERVALLNVPSFWQYFHTLSAFCSSWINPIIYGVMNRAMRNEFLKLLRCRKEK